MYARGTVTSHRIVRPAGTEIDQFKKISSLGAAASTSAADYDALRDRFVSFVHSLLSTKKSVASVASVASTADTDATTITVPIVPPRAVRETLQPEFLDTLGIFAAAALSKQMVSVRTSAWYRQQKFNLLREETEGFAKLFTELSTFFLLPAHQVSVDLLVKKVESFIGFFDLDPNRVVDLLLDAFERSALSAPNSQLGHFLTLIDCFQRENVTQMIGFKFRNYYQQYVDAQKSGAKATSLIGVAPQSLYDLAAVLIKTGRIQMEALYAHVREGASVVHRMSCASVSPFR